MIFNSFEFAVFFIAFLLVFFASPQRLRGVVVLGANYIFYGAWKPAYCLLLLFTTLVDYFSGLGFSVTERVARRRLILIAALSVNVGLLAFLKYFDFLATSLTGFAGLAGATVQPRLMNLALPVGISFYTFQSIAYTIDVYLRRVRAERSFLTYATYVSFFPQLVAGPIERAGHMLPQFHRLHFLRADNFSVGLWLIGWGLFKKMCVADVMAPFVNAVYAAPQRFNGACTILATLMFAIQIYADFSGYSTIARGVAKMFDYDLMVNFRQPYFATSLTDFWHRWHISLSTWFRDYVYLPLGGSRATQARKMVNILVVFVLSGLWHGAAWTFILWGALHGAALVAERLWRGRLALAGPPSRLFRLGGWIWTMGIVTVGWAIFRARTWSNLVAVGASLGHIGGLQYDTLRLAQFPSFSIATALVVLPLLLAGDYIIYYRQRVLNLLRQRSALGAVAGVALLYLIVFFGVFGHADFIYFQF